MFGEDYAYAVARIRVLETGLLNQAAIEQLPVAHPDYPGVGITISQLSGPTDDPKAKLAAIATGVYGAREVVWTAEASKQLDQAVADYRDEAAEHLPFRRNHSSGPD